MSEGDFAETAPASARDPVPEVSAAPTPARLDARMAALGLARSRTHAARLIADGLVTIDGTPTVKPATLVSEIQEITVAASDNYVSRGAHKLIAALDAFGVDPAGRVCLDAGASTGGFTQVLLERGAKHVVAIDVGHSQLASEIQESSRVTSVEGFNIRRLTAETLREILPIPEFPTVVVGDLSFISLTLVLEPLKNAVVRGADFVLLVKPQFEVGRTGVREGIVTNAGLRDEAVMTVLWAAFDLGLSTAGVIASPIAGTAGNREYLVWLSERHGSNPSQWTKHVTTLA